ncbi:hypothetical protein E1264_07340 [Actinomadura sp. KC216]|uniref:DUF6292 family protein n=1 Tax=Actinomadura sp. KC216 TaxID=2530370 RepID=UPI00105373CB|nr:DUF6292 family protein [Actinomadura sp. KC216]TDB89693.1 hypothetical protein E1264_07340 [Actinomadura sp. KC216]
MSYLVYPAHHPDREIDTAHGYISTTVEALARLGVRVDHSWLDPRGPIDATIVTGGDALVWDEWTGWRAGTFLSGTQGERTVLRDAVQLGGSVLLEPERLADLYAHGSTLPFVTREPEARDGLFDRLRRY